MIVIGSGSENGRGKWKGGWDELCIGVGIGIAIGIYILDTDTDTDEEFEWERSIYAHVIHITSQQPVRYAYPGQQ